MRSETDVESVLWAGNQAALAARHAAHRDGPFAKLEGAARVDHCNLQAKAILVALVAKLKGTADARAIYNLPAEAVAVELGGVEGRLGDLLWGDARHDVRFCQKRSVDRQRTVVECEHSLLRLDIDSEAGCRQEVVERIVAPTEVGGAAVRKRHVIAEGMMAEEVLVPIALLTHGS